MRPDTVEILTHKGPDARIAVVIPAYRVNAHLAGVVRAIGPEVEFVFVVDDACPDRSGGTLLDAVRDPRVRVLTHEVNQGVGGAVLTGYAAAIAAGADVIVKIDGDGQMDPALLRHFVAPLISGTADYTKGNRFYELRHILRMPPVRLIGNAALSFLAKLSTGYWNVFDPTNGYTAIHARIAERLPTDKISKRYFFETDMLFRLNTLRCVVADVPMDATYSGERSSLRVSGVLGEFAAKHVRNFISRIFYNYFLRDFTVASIQLVLGVVLLAFGVAFGGLTWIAALESLKPTPLGTIMLSAISTLAGLQLILAFIAYDVAIVPQRAVHVALQPCPTRAHGSPTTSSHSHVHPT